MIAALNKPPRNDGAAKAGGSLAPHALYNIGYNRSEPLMRLIGLIEDSCGKKAVIDFQPMQPGDVVQTYADIQAIGTDLGYRRRHR